MGRRFVIVMNMNELLRNDASYQNQQQKLQVELIGTKSNRSAIGARVQVKSSVRVQVQEVTSNPVTTHTMIYAYISAWSKSEGYNGEFLA